MENMKHGETKNRIETREYKTWKAMKARCYDKKNISYYNYGARGIKVCKRWLNNYSNFLKDIGRKPTNKHSLDRINTYGDYTPKNCRWATREEQRRNSRNVTPITFNGETRLIIDWSGISGIPQESISGRLRKGWSIEDAIFKPLGLLKTNCKRGHKFTTKNTRIYKGIRCCRECSRLHGKIKYYKSKGLSAYQMILFDNK